MNLREVRDRIASVKSTQKITAAMKLVSSAKLRRAQGAIEGMLPYSNRLNGLLTSFLAGTDNIVSEYSTLRECRKVVIIAVSSNTGLCGTFNANIVNMVRDAVSAYSASGVEVEIYTVGKKINDAVKKMGYTPSEELMSQAAAPRYDDVSPVARNLMERFHKGEIDKVDIIYSRFRSAARQEPANETLLPVDITSPAGIPDATSDYIVEPGRDELLSALIPKVIEVRLFTAFLDSVAAEHAARVLAMQVATDNATDLISELTLEYNKGRQQAITNELLDIVAGSAGQL